MYQIIIKKKAKKFIDSLPVNERRRVVAAIELLPNGEDIKKKDTTNFFGSVLVNIVLFTPWTMAS